jgi:hypothetical protein
MKKILAILFSGVILLAGMHLSYSAHFCHGNIAATKWSLSGKLASCGMEDNSASCPVKNKSVTSNCCSDKIVFLHVDDNFKSSFVFSETIKKILQFIPLQFVINSFQTNIPLAVYTDTSPPQKTFDPGREVQLAKLCVFRI